jgi:hypothetical protein
MENKKDIGAGRKFLYFIIVLIVFIFLVEGLLSMYYYQKNGGENIASLEALKIIKKKLIPRTYTLDVTNHNTVRPDSSQEVNHSIAEESIKSNVFIHESWVEYRNKDFDGDYMRMSGSVRKSDPACYYSAARDDTLDIYFFGGSTMFGFNLLDHETIPSQFVRMYKEKYRNSRSIRVFNYGTPTYYSYQELVLLSDLMSKGHRPDMVVFLDGINDFWFATASYYRQSYFSYIFRQMFNEGLRSKGDFNFLDTAEAMSKDRDYIPTKEFNDKILSNYLGNIENIRMMANIIGAKTYFFCQPSPFYNYPNQQKDPICFKDTNTRFNYIYPLLEKMEEEVPDFTYLGNMLTTEKGYPFVDGLHYSPEFIRKIVGRIFATMEEDVIRQ